MAAGDTLRRITPQDQFIVDVNGNVVGVKSPNANGNDLRFDPSSVARGLKSKGVSISSRQRQNFSGGFAIPVMSSGAPTLAWTATSSPSTVGLPQQWSFAKGCVRMFGGTPVFKNPGYAPLSRFFAGTPQPDFWMVEGDVTDSVVGIFLFGNATNGIRIRVDDQLVSATPTTDSTGSYTILKLDFSAVGGRARRKIGVEFWGGGAQFIAFNTSATGVVAPTNPDPFKLMILGDSVADGTGATWNGAGWARLCFDQLGIVDGRVSADGGTGFITVSGTGIQNFVTRVADVLAQSPDALVCALSSNDYNQTAAAVSAAVGTFLSAIRAGLPNCPILIVGSLWNDASLATAQAQEAAVTSMIAARNDPMIGMLPSKVSGNVSQIIWGTGSTTATTGTGNADFAFNGTAAHPGDEGHQTIARYVAQGFRNFADGLAAAYPV